MTGEPWKAYERAVRVPRLFVYTGAAWLWLGGLAGLSMLLLQASRGASPDAYYRVLTLHGFVMVFPGLFQLMMGLSLMRAGLCFGKPVEGGLYRAAYALINGGAVLLGLSTLVGGVGISYTLMYPLPAAGVEAGLWSLTWLLATVVGIFAVILVVVYLYPAALAGLLFLGTADPGLRLESARFRGLRDPAMLGMAAYIFMVVPTGSLIAVIVAAILLYLLGLIEAPLLLLDPVRFNYSFWLFAHTLMEAMGVMALATIYFIVPIYTRSGRVELYSWRLGMAAVALYSAAAPLAFFHHLYTMVKTQPLAASYAGQAFSWLTGLGAALTVFNILATGARHGYYLKPPNSGARLASGLRG